jgi:hypothetical protein
MLVVFRRNTMTEETRTITDQRSTPIMIMLCLLFVLVVFWVCSSVLEHFHTRTRKLDVERSKS